MNCFECAKTNDTVAAVSVCRHCGGTVFACGHELPRVKPLRSVPAGIAAAARHHTAGIA